MPGQSSDFVLESRERGVGLKSAVLEFAALERGLKVERLDRSLVVVKAPKVSPLVFRNINGPLSSVAGRTLCDRKHYARRLLRSAGLPVTPSRIFNRGERTAAWSYAQSLGLPVVIKPPSMSRGRGITTGIESWEEFANAWRTVMDVSRNRTARFLVEKHIYGEDYRVHVVGDRFFSATHRKRASVLGDGVSTVAQLIDEKNAVRARHPSLLDYLIPTDIEHLDRLQSSGLSLQSVPADGEEVTLRSTSNLSSGGDSIDVTEQMHPILRDIAIKSVAAIPGMEYAGVDLIAASISDPASPENHVVSEIEYTPAPISNFPVEGEPRDMAGAVLDFYLKRYRKRRWG